MNKIPALLVLLMCPVLAAAEECDSLEAASWLLGHWETERGATESWSRVSDDTFEGHGFDGRSHETLRLVEMSGAVFFIAKVPHNEMPTSFRLTSCSDDTLVFENPAHDFPRRLEYRRQYDALQVIVSDGGERGFQLMFHRHNR